ncbi:Succinate--hydroxymethylglutarate CoA-transferase [Dissostichus eleginoides]|uniref:Succinate--hydroxymethylglutarate CoA-transferase n=1 Tax=Dissostichus eleginoides TaxID=100907 RepID=A0AAD9B1W9_DISEL|nr:Succinate--hydroxymethylglutarate CoA-transferase [Dissostichus eleginoides]
MSAAVRVFKGRLSALCLRGLTPQTPGNPPVKDTRVSLFLDLVFEVRLFLEQGLDLLLHLVDLESLSLLLLQLLVQGLLQEGGGVAPLHGLRVLDLTRVLAGPFASMILGDLGAEVIKVERPGAGDDTRSWGPPFVGSESAYFLSVNRNKKSICVDMKNPRGASVIKENFLPGKLSSLGLGFDQLIRVNPRLVYCSISGYDSIASAVSGMMHITGPEDGGPVRPGVAMTDLATGLYAHGAIMAALLQRERTGGGAHIDCNLLSSQVSCLTHIASNFLNAGQEAKRWGTAHQSIVPYQGFSTRDGHIVVAAGNNTQFIRVCEVLQLKELAEDPNFKSGTFIAEPESGVWK